MQQYRGTSHHAKQLERMSGLRGVQWLQAAAFAAVIAASGSASAGYDIPTGAPASPLFGARPFEQPMLRFEEFGTKPMPEAGCTTCLEMPMGRTMDSMPTDERIDRFLEQAMDPMPTRDADEVRSNPWEPMIESMMGPMGRTYADGRPPGPLWGHQRWEEFPAQRYLQSAQTGARKNGGMRDGLQRHGYAVGEFGPGGLYHNTAGASAAYAGTTNGIEVRLHPNMPVQDPRAVWTFDGTFPPKLLMAQYGVPLLFRHYNALPIDPAANYGFGLHTISTHEHNGHNPAESDGYTSAYFFPGQHFDYHWPMILAGHDSINTDASDPRAATPVGFGSRQIPGDWRETMSTHWFHDHMLDFTAPNVYKGNAAMMNYYSAVDRGNEGLDCHYEDPENNVNLCLPSGTELGWGNRDYDVNLMLADKAWDSDGQLYFNIFNLDGFMGDRITVNWLYKPYMEVRARRYRFRMLNGSVSRYFKTAIVDQNGNRVRYHMVANDGNIMTHAIPFPNAESQDLPTHAIAERYDIVIDFAQFKPGDRIYLVNLIEHDDGKGPKGAVPLREVLSGEYVADGDSGDPGVGKVLEFRVGGYDGNDTSMNPIDYEPGKLSMIPLPRITAAEVANARHRTFEFGRSGGTDSMPWTIKTDGGQGYSMDPNRVSAAPEEGTLEIWHLENGGGGWGHPIHIHFEEGRILQRGGKAPPLWEKWARKDVYRVGRMDDSTDSVTVALRFREFLGTYMEHCHNTQHEDHAMLLRWDIEAPGQQIAMPAPHPKWDGVFYEDGFKELSADDGSLEMALSWDPMIGMDEDEAEPPVAAPVGAACGDVDGDGITSIGDALMLAQYQVGMRGCGQFDFYGNGDVDTDDSCTIVDALRIAQCDVGLSGCDFNCGAPICTE